MAISIGPRLSNATGGSISTITGYTVHTFTTDGSFTPTQNGKVEVLIVGGGGAGAPSGISTGSGGGAGSIVYKKYQSVVGGNPYSINVGSGGGPSPSTNTTTFTSNGTYTPTEDGAVEVLIVGGGGGAGTSPGPDYGGAGAGSVLYKKFQSVTGGTGYPVIIGAAGNIPLGESGSAGGNTVVFGITAPGGKGPSEPSDDPLGSVPSNSASNPAGSGGGGRRNQEGGLGANIIGYGYSGGPSGGGGGGAGGEGNPSGTPWPAHAGAGVTYSISGSSVYYGRGGGAVDGSPMPSDEAVLYNNGYGFGGDADDYPSPYGGSSGPSRRFAAGRPGIVIIRDNSGLSGSASTAFGVTAPGGAGAGKSNPAGSGGGLSFRDTSSDGPVTFPGTLSGGTGANVDKLGYSGGEANSSTGAGGGGGGAIGAGQSSIGGGLGGSGYISSISGIATTYSHGGPANGASDPTYIPGNYGNGGAGGAVGTGGVVIIRYVS